MFKPQNLNLSWNRDTFKLLLVIFILWSIFNYLYFYNNNNNNDNNNDNYNDNKTNSTTQLDIGKPISIIQSQSQSKDVSIISLLLNFGYLLYMWVMYFYRKCVRHLGVIPA
jgi:hypothetical protein